MAAPGVDIAINYLVLAITAAYFVESMMSLRRAGGTRGRVAAFDCSAFAALWAFQIGLCVGVGCEGISIIWAALFGASFPDYWAFRGDTRRGAVARVLYATQCAASAGALVYYAVTEPLDPTTTAHACAVALGLAIGFIKNRCLSPSRMWWRAAPDTATADDGTDDGTSPGRQPLVTGSM